MESTTQEVQSVKAVLQELGVEVPRPMVILSDNLGETFIVKNPIGHSKLKRVVLDLHLVREKGEVVVKHISGKDQWANILTKALPPKLFTTL